jgi:hypothetical protein
MTDPQLLADGAGTAANSTLLILAAVVIGWLAVRRFQGKALRRVPRAAAWVAFPVAAALIALGLFLPSFVSPSAVAARPSSSARIQIVTPMPGEVFEGTADAPAVVHVRIQVIDGRIVPFTSTALRPNEGHVHLFLDNALVSMTAGTEATLDVSPGEHALMAEFAASDHGPFDPRVVASVRFSVTP